MGRKRKYSELTDEVLMLLRTAIVKDMKEEVMAELAEAIKGLVRDYIGSILDFPLTVRQAAQLTGRSEENIYKMCQRGTIPFTKTGAQIHINLKDINSALILVQNSD